jgi:hypothetical protein
MLTGLHLLDSIFAIFAERDRDNPLYVLTGTSQNGLRSQPRPLRGSRRGASLRHAFAPHDLPQVLGSATMDFGSRVPKPSEMRFRTSRSLHLALSRSSIPTRTMTGRTKSVAMKVTLEESMTIYARVRP